MKAFIVPNASRKNTSHILSTITDELKKYKIDYYIPDYSVFKDEVSIHKFYRGLINGALCSDKVELEDSDIIISVGGDGTIVRSAGIAAEYGIPILGINSGTLGFLAELEGEAIQAGIARLSTGDYNISYRNTLKINTRVCDIDFSELVINEITIAKPVNINVINLSISCDGKEVDQFSADGMLFSTATGSTAYALSAGGPIIDPALSVINMVAICPHDIGIKPIIFSADRKLCITVSNSPIVIIPDGKERIAVAKNEKIYVTGGEELVGFISFGDRKFFEILSNKLKKKK